MQIKRYIFVKNIIVMVQVVLKCGKTFEATDDKAAYYQSIGATIISNVKPAPEIKKERKTKQK